MSRGSSSNVFLIDPASPAIPDGLEAPDSEIGTIVALLADEAPRSTGWSVSFAVNLASAWAEEGLQVVLADGDLAGATLHSVVGAENDEGVADLVLYGASPARVTRPGVGSAQFVPAGTPVVDVAHAYRHPRWSAFFTGARQVGLTVVVYLPAESEGVAELVEQADRVIRLVAETGDVEPLEGVTVIGAGEGATSANGAGTAAVGARSAPGRGREPRVRTSPASDAEGKGGRWRVILLVILAIVLALVIAASLGYIDIPGVTPGALAFFSSQDLRSAWRSRLAPDPAR